MLDFEQWADEAISIVSGDTPPASPGRDGPPAEPDLQPVDGPPPVPDPEG